MNIEDSKVPPSLKPRGKEGILSHVLVDENVLVAEAKADSLIEKARLNEAIKIVEQVEIEVRDMKISSRFSRTAKPSESGYKLNNNPIISSLRDLAEDEYKRQTILMNLTSVKDDINHAIMKIKNTILDIEATKQE